ncbi:unnamed protein product, partial [Meganyctiphanes norvegica]
MTSIHGWPYQCSICDKAFSHKHSLIYHQRLHTGEKTYHCIQCDTGPRIHTVEKPYHCSQCEKYFTWKDLLANHKIIHTGEKPNQCSQCDKAFSHKHSLVSHQRVH